MDGSRRLCSRVGYCVAPWKHFVCEHCGLKLAINALFLPLVSTACLERRYCCTVLRRLGRCRANGKSVFIDDSRDLDVWTPKDTPHSSTGGKGRYHPCLP